MKTPVSLSRCGLGALVSLIALVVVLAPVAPAPVAAADLEEFLEDVGRDYARAYVSPLLNSVGPNLNSALYSTAAIPQSQLTFGFGIKVMATHLNEADQSFRRVISNIDLHALDNSLPVGTMGTVIMSGPTVLGDTGESGSIDGYVGGFQVFSQTGLEGLVNSRYAPLAVPEISVGGISGLRATVRYLPEIEINDVGKTKVSGFGLQWNVNGLLNTLPVDVMIGFFTQSLDIGDAVSADASSKFIAVSKSLTAMTLYGGYALESSDTDVSYTHAATGRSIVFGFEGTQESRLTVGATLDVLSKINIEVGHGDVTTYAAGLMFGF